MVSTTIASGVSLRILYSNEDFSFSAHRVDGKSKPMRVRSMVGLIPLYACLVLEDEVIQKLPGFRKRLQWFLKNRQDLATQVCKPLQWCWHAVHVDDCVLLVTDSISGHTAR